MLSAYEVPVAIVGAIAIVCAATVPSVFSFIVNRRIGKPNGRGNIAEMAGQALAQAEDAKHIAIATRAEMNDRLDTQDHALRRIEVAMRAVLIDRGHADPPEG